jgi:hypothetical protein
MATFPELEPAARAYDFGQFPLTEEASISAGTVRFSHGDEPENYRLTLGYIDLTDAEADLIRQHYQGQGGGYRSFQLPSIIWRGHTFSGNVAPYTTLWRYVAPPAEDHASGGYVTMTVELGSDGTADDELALPPVYLIMAGGAATGA